MKQWMRVATFACLVGGASFVAAQTPTGSGQGQAGSSAGSGTGSSGQGGSSAGAGGGSKGQGGTSTGSGAGTKGQGGSSAGTGSGGQGSSAGDAKTHGGANTQAGGGAAAADGMFMRTAAMSSMAEVEHGRLAAQNATHDEVKQFGQRMVDDHTKANGELKGLASTKNVTLPAELDAKHKAMQDKLSKMKGDAFDRAYMAHMVTAHQEAVSLFQREAKTGKDNEAKAWATKTLPTLQEHLKMARGINAKVAGGGKSSGAGAGSGSGAGTGSGAGAGAGAGSSTGTSKPSGAEKK